MHKITVSLATAALLLFSVATNAQTRPPTPNVKVSPNAEPIGEGRVTGNRELTVQKKWNNIHAKNCQTFGSGNNATIVLTDDDEEISLTTTAAFSTTMAAMAAQCATGNWVSFYVTKVLSGGKFTWTNFLTWDYK